MTITINDPVVLDEVREVFERYEHALVNNLVEELDALFWNAPQTVRYGSTENLYGYAAIQAFRAARPPAGLGRKVVRRVITTYGQDAATTCIEFRREGAASSGRQTQTWIRMTEGWRVVAAHVSLLIA